MTHSCTRLSTALLLVTFALLIAPIAAQAAVTVAPIIADGMVLQQGMKDPIWGKAAPGESVTVTFYGATVTAAADATGVWRVDLPAVSKAGGPWPMTIKGSSEIDFKEVYVGDVWLCTGQSNMANNIERTSTAAQAEAENTPLLRLSSGSGWLPAQGDAIKNFSGTGYYFGKALADSGHVPIGLINASIGGTFAEQWTPDAALKPLGTTGGSLYKSIIAPLMPFAIKGVIWYQGENNVGRDQNYRQVMIALIASWRQNWGQGDFPFLFMQLPRLQKPKTDGPSPGDGWALLRDTQTQTLMVPNTGMAIYYDATYGDLHPSNKIVAGRRFALLARAMVYHEISPAEGMSPVLAGATVAGNKVTVAFKFDDNGLETGALASGTDTLATASPGAAIKDLWVTGLDGGSTPAKASIQGKNLVIDIAGQPTLPQIYYACSVYPQGNLYSKAGLPVSPFRLESTRLRPDSAAGNVLTFYANKRLDPNSYGDMSTYSIPGYKITDAEMIYDNLGVRLTLDHPVSIGTPLDLLFHGLTLWDNTTPMPDLTVTPSASFKLGAGSAVLQGTDIRRKGAGDQASVGYWYKTDDYLKWDTYVPQSGAYDATITYGNDGSPQDFVLDIGGQTVTGTTAKTGEWETYKTVPLGRLNLTAGAAAATLKPGPTSSGGLMDFVRIDLTPAK